MPNPPSFPFFFLRTQMVSLSLLPPAPHPFSIYKHFLQQISCTLNTFLASASQRTHPNWHRMRPQRGSVCCVLSCSAGSDCDHIDCILPGSSVHRILQARILEWVAMPSRLIKYLTWASEVSNDFLNVTRLLLGRSGLVIGFTTHNQMLLLPK